MSLSQKKRTTPLSRSSGKSGRTVAPTRCTVAQFTHRKSQPENGSDLTRESQFGQQNSCPPDQVPFTCTWCKKKKSTRVPNPRLRHRQHTFSLGQHLDSDRQHTQSRGPNLDSDTASTRSVSPSHPGMFNVPQGWYSASSTLRVRSLPSLSSPSRLRRSLASPVLLPRRHLHLKQVNEKFNISPKSSLYSKRRSKELFPSDSMESAHSTKKPILPPMSLALTASGSRVVSSSENILFISSV